MGVSGRRHGLQVHVSTLGTLVSFRLLDPEALRGRSNSQARLLAIEAAHAVLLAYSRAFSLQRHGQHRILQNSPGPLASREVFDTSREDWEGVLEDSGVGWPSGRFEKPPGPGRLGQVFWRIRADVLRGPQDSRRRCRRWRIHGDCSASEDRFMNNN